MHIKHVRRGIRPPEPPVRIEGMQRGLFARLLRWNTLNDVALLDLVLYPLHIPLIPVLSDIGFPGRSSGALTIFWYRGSVGRFEQCDYIIDLLQRTLKLLLQIHAVGEGQVSEDCARVGYVVKDYDRIAEQEHRVRNPVGRWRGIVGRLGRGLKEANAVKAQIAHRSARKVRETGHGRGVSNVLEEIIEQDEWISICISEHELDRTEIPIHCKLHVCVVCRIRERERQRE